MDHPSLPPTKKFSPIAAWSQQNVIAFRDFLAHNPNFYQALQAKKMKIEGDSLEKAALNAKERDGFDKAVDAVRELADDASEPETEAPFINTERDS